MSIMIRPDYVCGLTILVLSGLVSCQWCDGGLGVCAWTSTQGLQTYTIDQSPDWLCSPRCPEYMGNTGGFAMQYENTSQGTIEELFTLNGTTTVFLAFDVYVAANDVTNDITTDAAITEVVLYTDNKSQPIRHTLTSSAGRWKVMAVNFTVSEGRHKVTIDVTLGQSSRYILINNIELLTDDYSANCSQSGQFPCSSTECVPWESVCNLHTDCTNARDEHVCHVLPEFMQCSFEVDDCGWHNVDSDHFDWQRGRGPGDTPGTGPTVDHTTFTKHGYYMYIDSGDGRFLEHAILQSDVMPPITGTCKLRFFYHMIGRDVGSLEVLQIADLCVNQKQRRRPPSSVWLRQGKQPDRWNLAEAKLENITSRFYIQFKATGALIYHGDIAVDDISFSPECFGYHRSRVSYTASLGHDPGAPVTWEEFTNDTNHYCLHESDDGTVLNSSTVKNSSLTEASPVHVPERHPERIGVAYIVAITLSAVVISIVMGTAVLCIALRHRKESGGTPVSRLEMVPTSPDENCSQPLVQSSSIDMRLRCAVTELNPNYDFITAKYPEQTLREIPRCNLKLLRLLGQGAFGEVYEGILKAPSPTGTDQNVAVKTLQALSTEEAETDFLMEAVIISKFMHKNVVKCLGVCFEEHPRYIILELLEGGDLKNFLRDSRPKQDEPCLLTMKDLVRLAIDIANGCHHLEEKHFVHRDIAARNILLTSRGPSRVAKIADFGMSRDIYSADYYRKGGRTMLPIKWMPPEAFLDGVFTTKTDVWSFGVLLWEIFTLGYMPYPGQTNTDVMHFVSSGGRLDPPQHTPARLNKIMILCWNSIADIRPSFSEIIELLDMCLQDNDVLSADVSGWYNPMLDCSKDASTLTKSLASCDTPCSEESVEFRGHVESESREPLLLLSDHS